MIGLSCTWIIDSGAGSELKLIRSRFKFWKDGEAKKMMKGCLVTLMVLVAPLVGIGSLNYSGFCIPEGRWLSEEELFDSAMRYSFSKYKKIEKGKVPSGPFMTILEKYSYESYINFKNQNVGCCDFNDEIFSKTFPPVSSGLRFVGKYREIVRTKFRVQENPPLESVVYAVVANCGTARRIT